MRKEDSKVDESAEDLHAELLRFQRQFRLLEDDRRVYREETEYSLQKQRESIKVLNEEHDELAKDNKLAGSAKVKNFDADNTENLKNLLAEEKLTKGLYFEQKLKLDGVNEKIEEMLEVSDVQRKRMGGCKESERKTKEMSKMIKVMENRLNEANKKFNVALAENNKMRQEIDHINIQRKKFDDLHKNLCKMFQDKKKEKDFLVETATCLFNSRDEAHNRMQSLRERCDRDVSQYYSELKDLLRVIDHDKKLREFMTTKSEERGEMYEATIQGRKEKKLRDYIKSLRGEVEHYEEIFAELKRVCGIEEIEEMVEKFIRVEDENFASFNYIKEQSQQIQEKEAAIVAFKEQIEKMGVDETVFDAERKQIMERHIQEDKELASEQQRLATRVKEEQEKLDKIAIKVDSMFDQINCSRSAITALLGGSKISSLNLLSFLGIIEQRASELIQARTLIATKYKTDPNIDTQPEPNVLTFHTIGKLVNFMINPPSLLEDIPDSASQTMESSRPLSQHETRMMINTLAKIERERKVPDTPPKKY